MSSSGAHFAGDNLEVTVLLPCLNEAETLETCVRKALGSLTRLGVRGEVLVSDNGSTDGSPEIARRAGARVITAPRRGYGAALIAGIEAARSRYVIMADADDSYDLTDLGPFIDSLRAGHDVVMGNRFRGGIAPGAMPFLHRYLGNPVLSWLGRRLFGLRSIGDFHCGIRGFDRHRIRDLDLRMPGMEFASELVVRAALNGYDLTEVPTTLRPDGRSRPPHLRTWRDGWRHLRFLLVFAPRRTLLWPGTALLLTGLLATIALATGSRTVAGVRFDVNALVYACLAVLAGAQIVLFGAFAELYGQFEGLVRRAKPSPWVRWLSFERSILFGVSLILLGLAGTGVALGEWGRHGFGDLDPRGTIRLVLPSATAIGLGAIGVFSGLFASLLTLRGMRPEPARAALRSGHAPVPRQAGPTQVDQPVH
ncbi:glycosyltransferase family 2 protein [Paractinoplanes rishiriensis]|uniref:Dolichol-P-glucose synthetase n=1 Tax=Paractinoplanes rishiriensis TaxID=1050105 RepID=A0A919MZE4_9ACTN|nr:glycosyltransferase family 2 protein [Actinoplanes rishiriensis]GIE98210.1 dolichol-P-glucose synthetase [Actinoplanes rishiriensis]